MIINGLIFWLACFVFAWYNALSIKGMTGGKLWHLLQFAAVFLFLVCDFATWVKQFWYDWKHNNFHDFGRKISLWCLMFFAGVFIYVYSLHYILARMQ